MLKKVSLLFIIFISCVGELIAQLGGTHDYLDTAYIAPVKWQSKSIF